jgi:hypothetical protein
MRAAAQPPPRSLPAVAIAPPPLPDPAALSAATARSYRTPRLPPARGASASGRPVAAAHAPDPSGDGGGAAGRRRRAPASGGRPHPPSARHPGGTARTTPLGRGRQQRQQQVEDDEWVEVLVDTAGLPSTSAAAPYARRRPLSLRCRARARVGTVKRRAMAELTRLNAVEGQRQVWAAVCLWPRPLPSLA